MTSPHSPPERATDRHWQPSSLLKTCLVTLALAGGAFLLTRHTDHVISYLPYAVLLACPLMHIFMHRGHRHH